ncbi:MAG TPA: beta-propeller fold lactonase family protein [Galbitalea sp.]|jgi:6-phosphogluconolactonase (cycloisomerase 2 family)|nr:beta-propeller fold lactonase family protein [Galbitalea sp.]
MPTESAQRIWVGGYTDDMNGSAEGIGVLLVASDGSLEDHGIAVAAESPSFLTRSGDLVFAVSEAASAVAAYRIADNELHFQGLQATAGPVPCAVTVLGDCVALAVACYGDGSVDIHPIAPNGALGKTSQSLRGTGKGTRINQDGPHAHAVVQLDATTVLTTDLGTDDVYINTLAGDVLSRVGSVKLPAGSGPRDVLLHPSGVVLVLTELSNKVYVLSRDGLEFSIVSSIALSGSEEGDHAAAIGISADGRFGYSALRGTDLVSVFEISTDGRTLTPVGSVGSGGGWPRHLVVDGDRIRVANQLTNSVVTFAIGADGMPTKESSLYVPSPTYLLLD